MNEQSFGRWRGFALVSCALITLAWAACGDEGGGEGGGANNAAANNAANNANNTTPNNNPNNNANNTTGAACESDAMCGADEVCDPDAGFCRPRCATDADCPAAARCGEGGFCQPRSTCAAAAECTAADEVCNTCDGRCERSPNPGARACTVDMNCRDGEFCDPCRKICRPLGDACDPCLEDVECGGAEDLCLDFALGGRFCGRSCGVDDDCPQGFVCSDVAGTRQCTPRSGDCAHPGECDTDEDCPGGMRCGPRLSCVPGCTEGTCPNEQVCDNGACKAPCTSNAECPAPAECTEEGLCRIPGGCVTSRDCPDAMTFCDLNTNMCMPGCESDNDCPGTQVCRTNACMRRPCEGNFQCAFGQVCNHGNGMCEAAQGPHCEMCNADMEGQCGGEPNQCLRLQDEDGNALGDFCGVACTKGDPDACPVGYSCQELMDENMQVVAAVCFRACHRDPI